MSIEKLQKLAELDAVRVDLQKKLFAVENSIDQIIGDGFEIAGARVTPIKRTTEALPKLKRGPYKTREAVALPMNEITSEEKPGGENGDGSLPVGHQILNLMINKPERFWSVEDVTVALGLTTKQAWNALHYMYKTGKVTRNESGNAYQVHAEEQQPVTLPEAAL